MAIAGAVEISGRDLPQYDPSSEHDGSRVGYPAQDTTLFLINDTSKDIEKNIRLNQISNITSGINVDPAIGSGMVNREFTGFSFDFKSLRSGDESAIIFTDGPTGEVIKIKSNALYSGRNLGVADIDAQRQYMGTVYSGKVPVLEDGENLTALAFRSITGEGNILVTGVLQSKLKQAEFDENLEKRMWYKTFSGQGGYNPHTVYGDQLNLLWREGNIPYGENLFTISSVGAQVGYMCITARPSDQARGEIPLDFSQDRIIFLDLVGYRGEQSVSYYDIIPKNLKVGTTITMQVFPRAPFENAATELERAFVHGLMKLDPETFKVVGKSPYPFVDNDLSDGSRSVQPVRIHFLCVSETSDPTDFRIGGGPPPEPSILISFNDIEADFQWNTNIWLGTRTAGKKEEKYPQGILNSFDNIIGGYLGLTRKGLEDTWIPRSFPYLPSQYYPIRSYFGDGIWGFGGDPGDSKVVYGSDWRVQNNWRLQAGPSRGLNHSYLFGTIDMPSDYNDTPQSHRLYTGYDYRYKNTGLNLP